MLLIRLALWIGLATAVLYTVNAFKVILHRL